MGVARMKRLVVVADNSLIVEAIRIGLRQSGTFNLLGHVNARRTTVQTIVEAEPDIVLIDDMDHSDLAVELIRGIKTEAPRIAVIALTVSIEPEWLDSIFDAGATCAISKATHPTALATLIRETVNGNVVQMWPRPDPASSRRPHAVNGGDTPLTNRELEVLQHVAGGATNGEIARSLWVTEQTVKFHLSNVYRKLDVGNRTEASHYAHVNGLMKTMPVAAVS
jgi:DNA-binding NarL/FixJ family response regulator